MVPTVSCESAMETDDDNSDNELSTENQVRRTCFIGLGRGGGVLGCVLLEWLIGRLVNCHGWWNAWLVGGSWWAACGAD